MCQGIERKSVCVSVYYNEWEEQIWRDKIKHLRPDLIKKDTAQERTYL